MKKTLKRLLAAALVLVIALSLCACGGPKTPEEVVAKAVENLSKAKSMSYVMDMELGMAIMGESMDMQMTMDADTTTEPMAVHAAVAMEMAGTSVDMEMYAETAGDKYVSYIGMDEGSGTMTWFKQEVESLAEEGLNGQESLNEYMGMITNVVEGEAETINGVEATRYDGVIPKEYYDQVLESTGVMEDMMGSVTGSEEMEITEAMLESFSDMPISIWIDKKEYLPVKYEMEMTETMQKMMDAVMAAALEGLGETEGVEIPEDLITVDRVIVTMVIDGYDNVEAIVIPEEAKNAELIED